MGGSHACAAPPPAQGLERTEHEGFGGGNTAWEEEKLSKYQHRWVPLSWEEVWGGPSYSPH